MNKGHALRLVAVVGAATVLVACGGDDEDAGTPARLSCDDSLKTAYKPDKDTSVLLVRQYKRGDPLVLTEAVTSTTPTAANDICLVKLNVGPGVPGPADAPSTTPGIGIEVWLPLEQNWNGRVFNVGGGGLLGGDQGSVARIGSRDRAQAAGVEGSVAGSTDAGAARGLGDKFLLADGTASKVLWEDWTNRSLRELALKTKSLAVGFYGRPHRYAYFHGFSGGGRQAGTVLQKFPTDYNGVLIGAPALSMNALIAGDLYPQVVIQRDLGGTPISNAKLALVTANAVAACDVVGGQHLGYPIDPWSCRYDPTTDATLLCPADGGTNTTANCFTRVQAHAVNKVWYGMTADGSAPSPSVDNGGTPTLTGVRRWYGHPRGMNLVSQFGSGISAAYTGWMAATLQDPRIGTPEFTNATGNGQNSWKSWSYEELAYAQSRMVALAGAFGGGNDASSDDLSAFKAAGGKVVGFHGLADPLLHAQSQANYFERLAARFGGTAAAQDFYRLYLVPGLSHGSGRNQGVAGANAPLPTFDQYYKALTDWVENGVAPSRMEVSTDPAAGGVKTAPLCVYPLKRTYVSGDPNVSTSYSCS